MTCIYNLHRQRQKTYDMYIQFTQTKDKKHMTCIYNLHRKRQKNIWHVYTIYTDKRHMTCYTIYIDKRQKTYDMYIQFTQTKDI